MPPRRYGRACPGHPDKKRTAPLSEMPSELGPARVPQFQAAAHRINPMCGVKRGHDEREKGCLKIESEAVHETLGRALCN